MTDLRIGNNTAAFLENGRREKDLFSDHSIVLVVGVIGVPELAIWPELELQELVAELPLMPYVIPQVKLTAACGRPILLFRHLSS